MNKTDTSGFSTAAESAYQTIRTRVLAGDFKPGEKLSRRNMAKLTGVSVIPVIEALKRLEQDGLVESMPHWGTRVVEMTETRIRDYFALREAVECQVVRMLAGKLDAVQILFLESLAAEIDKPVTDDGVQRRFKLHYEFHLKLAEYTRCQSLADALSRAHLFFLLKSALETRRSSPRVLPPDWHQRIVVALKTDDPDHAETIMRDHVRDSGVMA